MIQSVSAIEMEFLIKTAALNELPVRFHGISTTGTGLIAIIDRNSLDVNLLDTFDDTPFSVYEHITGYFDCHGNTYAFETIVRDSKKKGMKIDTPIRLLKSLQRKYVRVRKPRDVNVLIHLTNEDILLDYPVCPEYVSVESGAQSSVPDNKKIPELVQAFREQLLEKCTESSIIMFRTKKPELFEEQLVSKTGKVLFIPSTGSGLPGKDPYPEGRIITRDIETECEDPNYFIDGSMFDKLQLKKRMEGVNSEVWCPIVYYQYVVGYILIRNSGAESFDISMVDYLWDFSRILAYKLKQTGYFNTGKEQAPVKLHRTTIIDISPGGMLISLPRNEIRSPIREGSIFSIEIHPGKQRISCSARVMRRFEDANSISYGTVFTDLSSNDLMSLYEFLYRRPFTDNDPLAYEQKG